MSENIPSLPGALPPKPAESAKVQPKKETVRINLPPKPTAAPTIKLPTLPSAPAPSAASAAPVAATAAPVAAAAAPVPAAQAPKAPNPPSAGAPASRVAGGSPNRSGVVSSAGTPATAVRNPKAAAGPSLIATADKALAVALAVVCFLGAGIAAYLAFYCTNTTPF